MRLNPATRNSTQIQKLSVFLFIFVILILPAVVIVSASLVAATLVRDVDDQKMSAYSRQAAGDIKSEKELAQGKFLVADRRLIDSNYVLNADTETLFDKKSSEIWQELIQRVSVKWVRTIHSGKLLEQSYLRNPVRRKIIKRNWDRTKVEYQQLNLELKNETVFRP